VTKGEGLAPDKNQWMSVNFAHPLGAKVSQKGK
jgi:hypothetical protein